MDLLQRIGETLIDKFYGKTVGTDGDFSGSGCLSLSGTIPPHGPFPIQVNINQWTTTEVTQPSINLEPIQSEPMGSNRIGSGGSGKHRLWTQIRVSVDQQVHGQSIASILGAEIVNYLDIARFQPSGSGKEAYPESPQWSLMHDPNGQLLHYDYLVLWNYYV